MAVIHWFRDLTRDRSNRIAVSRLLAEQGIRDACTRYWAGVDQRDPELFASAFTADAEISLFGGSAVKVADMVRGGIDGGFTHTSHGLESQSITFEGSSTAAVVSFAIAHLVTDSGIILIRGLRYDDAVVKVESGWRIKRREHRALWQYDVNSVVPHVP